MTLHITSRPRDIKESYLDKANRDKRAQELKELGYDVVRRSARNQNMHPDYIKDYDGEGKGTNMDINPYYRTFFAVIYIVEAKNKTGPAFGKLFGYD